MEFVEITKYRLFFEKINIISGKTNKAIICPIRIFRYTQNFFCVLEQDEWLPNEEIAAICSLHIIIETMYSHKTLEDRS